MDWEGLGVALAFIALAPIAWSAVLPLAIGLFTGSRCGPWVVRRAPQTALLAQSVEHSHGKAGVVGSIPTEGSTMRAVRTERKGECLAA